MPTFTRLNRSAATLTKNRTEGSISPFSGMCVTCVDGCIGICFVDMLRNEMPKAEADEYIKMGALNGLFVLGRTIGLTGHFLDQKRLKQGLYRHPWDDITYMT